MILFQLGICAALFIGGVWIGFRGAQASQTLDYGISLVARDNAVDAEAEAADERSWSL